MKPLRRLIDEIEDLKVEPVSKRNKGTAVQVNPKESKIDLV